MKRVVLFALCITAFSGCVVGVRHDYRSGLPNLNLAGKHQVSIGVEDNRQQVIDGTWKPELTGTCRGGYGNAFRVVTVSGAPLADDFAATIANALQSKGHKVSTVKLAPGTKQEDAIQAIRGSQSCDRVILVVLNKWRSDTYGKTKLAYAVKAEIYDTEGKLLASNEIAGVEPVGGSFMSWNPAKISRRKIPEMYRAKLEALFNTQPMQEALR